MLYLPDTQKNKYMSGQYSKEIKLVFPGLGLEITTPAVYGETMSLEQAIFDGNGALEICGCIASRFSIEIKNPGILFALKDELIKVSVRIDGGTWLTIFTGYVDSVESDRTRSHQTLQCYDAFYKFSDVDFYSTYAAMDFPVSLYQIRQALVTYMGLAEAEYYDLINDAVWIEQTIFDSEISVLNAFKAICQANGVFGRINGRGEIEYIDISIGSTYLMYPSDDTFPAMDFYPSSDGTTPNTIYIDKYKKMDYEDYSVLKIDSVMVRDSESDAESSGKIGDGTRNTLLIEGNMWFTGLDKATKRSLASVIYNQVKYITYTPFEGYNLGLPWVEPGDAVCYYVYDYSNGLPADTLIMAFTIMSRHLKGIQWLEDRYDAKGTKYQPVIKNTSGAEKNEIESVKSEIGNVKNNKQDKLTAGTGIKISSNTISVTNPITYGTTDLTPGTSDLVTGTVYLMYE